MIPRLSPLEVRVLGWQAAFALGTAVLVAPLVPRLLLLSGAVQEAITRVLLYAVGTGGAVALVHNAIVLSRHRPLLGSLGGTPGAVSPVDLAAFGEDSGRVVTGWVAPPLAGLALTGTLFRPALVDLTTGVSVALLGTVFVAAASLPLSVLVRGAFAETLERVPPDAMRSVIEAEEKQGTLKRYIPRRLLFAVALPVALVSIGAALVTNAVVRRADERDREALARLLARAALDASAGTLEAAGVEEAIWVAERAGYVVTLNRWVAPARTEHERGGAIEVSTPLEQGTAHVRFGASSVGVFGPVSMVVSLLAVALAALFGLGLGRALNDDVATATRGVRLLGTDSVIGGSTRVMRPVRFRVVEELGLAIERLADRFRVFARAQERAIAARERAARMRGLFFASVSHDLKSPLNAILGFTDLVRDTETLSAGQLESLDLIAKRGRELLALIETILDASRVEARQLTLVRERVRVEELFEEALAKGRDLGGDPEIEVIAEIVGGVPDLHVDRLRLTRALATIIGHALRSSERAHVRMRAAPSRAGGARIDVEVPSTRVPARELAGMLDPNPDPGEREHRGLALGLSLARAIIELHGGSVAVTDRGTKGSVFTVRIPVGVEE
ncbi:MAG: HAMP domain-containing histidine kinase [Polyangiaceae bacterium]|nr:HAMP domain-containing histidine kinase [Polyangiaceae bacterium]MCL4754258.1 HAMP domain-containing histidine kinase [Myxococcales bacterium]